MKQTLYLVKQPLDRIDPSLFSWSASTGDVVLLQGQDVSSFSYAGGTVFSLATGGPTGLSYDELVKKIFEYERTIVI